MEVKIFYATFRQGFRFADLLRQDQGTDRECGQTLDGRLLPWRVVDALRQRRGGGRRAVRAAVHRCDWRRLMEGSYRGFTAKECFARCEALNETAEHLLLSWTDDLVEAAAGRAVSTELREMANLWHERGRVRARRDERISSAAFQEARDKRSQALREATIARRKALTPEEREAEKARDFE